MITSVIIPTYNGAKKLPGILNSLMVQTKQPHEIIIVVDGSTDNSRAVLESYLLRLPSLKVIFQCNQGRGAVRNNGARAAKGDVLIFLDDDIRLQPDGVEQHLQFHERQESAILFGRATLDPLKIKSDDFSRFRAEVESKSNFSIPQKAPIAISFENYGFTSANMSCPKSLFQHLGGFDDQLRDSEDFDFSLRALQEKIPIFYHYSLLGWHDDYISLERFIYRQVQYVRSKQFLGILKPEMKSLHPASFEYGIETSSIKEKMRKLFVVNKFWLSLTKTVFFRKLMPKVLRYMVYDLIISSSVINKMNSK